MEPNGVYNLWRTGEGVAAVSFYNGGMRGSRVGGLAWAVAVASVVQIGLPPALAQTPQPFPRPGAPQQPVRPATPPAQPAAPPSVQTAPADPNAPTEASLGFPIYPTAQFLASYDAGRGQRYFVFGATAPYADLVAYYRTTLKERGDQVFEQPPTHMFSVGRFREETMAFPPGVTIKDWTWGGSQGYPNPKLGAQPARFPTLVMIVPAPPSAATPR